MDGKSLIKLLIPFIILSFPGCSYIQKRIDISSIKGISQDIMDNFKPGEPGKLAEFAGKVNLSEYTRPSKKLDLKISPLKNWSLSSSGIKNLVEEKIEFPSVVNIKSRNSNAVFYVYRRGDLKGRDVILWIPGMGVSDFAFRFIKKFFKEELLRNYNIVFYNIPYHLERKETGRGNGDGFLTADNLRNIRLFLDCVKEVRTVIGYLREKGVKSIGSWGGSIGATIILLASHVENFDHMTIMIPVIDLNLIALDNVYMKDVVSELKDSGFMENDIRKAYRIISPVNYKLRIKPERMQILYAEYDQLTPPGVIKDYARSNSVGNIIGYNRSHATILLTSRMYRDYGRFLDSLKKNQ